ncbi:hypothetical protein TSAR_001728 [Trichomalopsis sarcophagae]|uniref:DUF4371 domain-containing protein n=1 Tax=Trichomalopsis sarcophagae TaxID=543379 RepID=A0A232F630_9HYME|nr:hypothetical protein TSAR_001728 [Trichomalopsis sarcophagae]
MFNFCRFIIHLPSNSNTSDSLANDNTYWNLIKHGSVYLDVRFDDLLTDTVNYIVYAEYKNVLEIDASCEIVGLVQHFIAHYVVAPSIAIRDLNEDIRQSNEQLTRTKHGLDYFKGEVNLKCFTSIKKALTNVFEKFMCEVVRNGSATAIFCGSCKLFSESQGLTSGYSDWSNIHHVVKDHEEIIKALLSRGLPFRGDDERFGSLHNGNYMMVLELISEFDPFLAEHIRLYGNAEDNRMTMRSICLELTQDFKLVLKKFNVLSKTLQSASVELNTVVELYHYLINFVSQKHDSENKVKVKSHTKESESNATQVTLTNIDVDAAGSFSCEITVDEPTFQTAVVSGIMNVVEYCGKCRRTDATV